MSHQNKAEMSPIVNYLLCHSFVKSKRQAIWLIFFFFLGVTITTCGILLASSTEVPYFDKNLSTNNK